MVNMFHIILPLNCKIKRTLLISRQSPIGNHSDLLRKIFSLADQKCKNLPSIPQQSRSRPSTVIESLPLEEYHEQAMNFSPALFCSWSHAAIQGLLVSIHVSL